MTLKIDNLIQPIKPFGDFIYFFMIAQFFWGGVYCSLLSRSDILFEGLSSHK